MNSDDAKNVSLTWGGINRPEAYTQDVRTPLLTPILSPQLNLVLGSIAKIQK